MMSDKKPSFESGLDLAPIHAMMECNEMRSEVDPSDNRLEWLVELWEGFSIFSSEKLTPVQKWPRWRRSPDFFRRKYIN